MCRIMLKIKKQLIAYRNNEGSFVDSTTSTIIISEINSRQWCETFGVKTLELQNIVMKVLIQITQCGFTCQCKWSTFDLSISFKRKNHLTFSILG